MAKKNVLILATNYGTWGEELQAPWDIIKRAGHHVTLATPLGKKPLPLAVSVDPDFLDPIINFKVNPPEVCRRIKELTDGDELKMIFTDPTAAAAPDGPARAAFVDSQPAVLTLTAATEWLDQGLALLIDLHAWAEEEDEDLDRRIWAFLAEHTNRHRFDV